jgi:O-antigen/teichoic acid export membrane protein
VLILPFIQIYTDGIPDADYIQPLFAAFLLFAHGFQCLRSVYNMPILAAGHYKQTQSCHIIAAVLNLTVSIVTVKIWGLIGVAIGTLLALGYQTVWMAVYNARYLLKCPIGNFVKHIVVDLLTVFVIVIIASRICWIPSGYLEWAIMAVLVSIVAFLIVGISAVIFYRDQLNFLKVYVMKKIKR